MKITVYGAEGEIGQKVISYALSQGAFVTACICDAGILWPRKNLTVVQGMMNNKEKVIEAMLEADIIISALTCGSTSRKSSGTPVADANATIISEASVFPRLETSRGCCSGFTRNLRQFCMRKRSETCSRPDRSSRIHI